MKIKPTVSIKNIKPLFDFHSAPKTRKSKPIISLSKGGSKGFGKNRIKW